MSSVRGPDPALDRFRNGIAALWFEGELAGHVATVVEQIWAPFRRQEQVGILVTWIDGRREPIFEDYEPWSSVAEFRSGHLLVPTAQGEIDFEVRWIDGEAREAAWERFGIVDEVGAFKGASQT